MRGRESTLEAERRDHGQRAGWGPASVKNDSYRRRDGFARTPHRARPARSRGCRPHPGESGFSIFASRAGRGDRRPWRSDGPGQPRERVSARLRVVTTASVSKTGTDSIERVDLQGNLNLIAAARAAGVRRFVFTSTLRASAGQSGPVVSRQSRRRAAPARERYGLDRPRGQCLHGRLVSDVRRASDARGRAGDARRRIARPPFLRGRAGRRRVRDRGARARGGGERGDSTSAGRTRSPSPTSSRLRRGRRTADSRSARRARRPDPRRAPADLGHGGRPRAVRLAVPMDETSRRYGVTLTSVREFARARLAARAS